jgi:hypothetical protein
MSNEGEKKTLTSTPSHSTSGPSLLPVAPLPCSIQALMHVSCTKSGLKWIWYENMVNPTLIKMFA